MKQGTNRHARKEGSRWVLRSERRPGRRTRWAVSLAATALVAGGAVSAQASTGGASSYTASGTSAAGQEFAFSPMRTGGASWYGGPSMWGRDTACGETLRPK